MQHQAIVLLRLYQQRTHVNFSDKSSDQHQPPTTARTINAGSTADHGDSLHRRQAHHTTTWAILTAATANCGGGSGDPMGCAIEFDLMICVLVTLMSILGDQSGYFLGYRTGPAIFRRPDSLLFKQEYVTRTQAFYAKHGGKTLVYAKFVPIVRTFAPFMAGVGRMKYCALPLVQRFRRDRMGFIDDPRRL